MFIIHETKIFTLQILKKKWAYFHLLSIFYLSSIFFFQREKPSFLCILPSFFNLLWLLILPSFFLFLCILPSFFTYSHLFCVLTHLFLMIKTCYILIWFTLPNICWERTYLRESCYLRYFSEFPLKVFLILIVH